MAYNGYLLDKVPAILNLQKAGFSSMRIAWWLKRQGYKNADQSTVTYVLKHCHRPRRLDSPFPSDVAEKQAQWERKQQVCRMLSLGFSFKKIGGRFDVSAERARQLAHKPSKKVSPIEEYFAERPRMNCYQAFYVIALFDDLASRKTT